MNTEELKKTLQDKSLVLAGTGNQTSKAYFLSKLIRDRSKIIWITEDDSLGKSTARQLKNFFEHQALALPEYSDDNLSRYMQSIASLINGRSSITLAEKEQLNEKFPRRSTITKNSIKLETGSTISHSEIFSELIRIGYEATDLQLIDIGTYSRRGNVIDIFPVNHTSPIRIELSDDERIENIWLFDVATNTPQEKLEQLDIYPLNIELTNKFTELLEPTQSLVILDEVVEDDLATQVLVGELERLEIPIIRLNAFDTESDQSTLLRYCSVLRYTTVNDFFSDILKKRELGWQIVVFSAKYRELIQRFAEKKIEYQAINGDREIKSVLEIKSELDNPTHPIQLVHSRYFRSHPEAWNNPEKKLLWLTDEEIFREELAQKETKEKHISMDFLITLKEQDYVVHIEHGIGQFTGICQKTVDDITKEYLELTYAGNDRLYVPVDQADRVSKFIGATADNPPTITRLGSSEWNVIQERARTETRKIAGELLELYAKRETASSQPMNKRSKWLEEFEEAFPYEETPGQLKAISEVYTDMNSSHPMDRLVCGDVGFGKTEVAMRAAFYAVQNGYQVAILTPITILADQHYKSFTKRMRDFPVRIDVLSRFRSPQEQAATVKRLAQGQVDIIIGTHRLLSDDVKFKNLGLLVIDEEQRFGVQQKEKLKDKRLQTHILTLSATPIPRTLNMSLSGIRDISTITTAPPGRMPIITEVRKFSFQLIREAILREKERGGQIYILHNQVRTIDTLAQQLQQLIPEASFIVAHGQMSPAKLEDAIHQFKEKKYDCLVSSTIIENGIDLPNANTLIVDRAESFGLSQLYQLRGRVGRSKNQAYAYFMYHTQKLKPDAKKRLKAVMEATELGAGFQIAMRDLEIRGAGNILSNDQHGTINAIGVAHFTRLLNQAVEDLRTGRKTDDQEIEISVDIPLEAYIPDDYISERSDKIRAYQRLSSTDTLEALRAVFDEITTTYGEAPSPTTNLKKLLTIKILARQAGLLNVKMIKEEIILHLGRDITPHEIMTVLDYNQQWIISGDKLKIVKDKLGEHWVKEIIKAIEIMKKARLKNSITPPS